LSANRTALAKPSGLRASARAPETAKRSNDRHLRRPEATVPRENRAARPHAGRIYGYKVNPAAIVAATGAMLRADGNRSKPMVWTRKARNSATASKFPRCWPYSVAKRVEFTVTRAGAIQRKRGKRGSARKASRPVPRSVRQPAPRMATEWTAWARSPKNPVGGWYGLKKGLRGRFGMYVPAVMEAMGLAEVEHLPKNNRMRAR